jgi:MoaA/NifB/PqqE/SkfB family radical SAM enzyme
MWPLRRLLGRSGSAPPLEAIRRSGLFDPAFYAEQAPELARADADLLAHYLSEGAGKGLDPHPGFSSSAYLRRYPDVAASGLNPLVHYVQHGRGEGRTAGPVRVDRPDEAREAALAVLARLPRLKGLVELHATLARHGVLPPDPRFLGVETDVTSGCNLRCRMCYMSLQHGDPRPRLFLTPEAFVERIGPVLPHTHALALSLGSEPLVSPHFAGILEAVARYRVPEVQFYTNGELLDERITEACLSHDVTRVCVSVDGATRETFEYIRRGASFERVLGNVRALVARRRASDRERPVVRFDVVMMRRNAIELEGLVDLAGEAGAGEMSFTHLVPYAGLGMEAESLARDRALSNASLERALARAREIGVKVTGHPDLFALGSPPGAPSEGRDPFADVPYCRYPFHHACVDAGGHVLACPFAHGEPPMGRVSREEPLAAVWLGPGFTRLRMRILQGDPPEMCRRCSFLAGRHPDRAALLAAREPSWGPDRP